MNRTLTNAELRASQSHPASGVDPDEWFCGAAHEILGKQVGLQLHLLTGYPLTSCGYYVARDPDKRRPAPDHLVRRLIHAEHGEPWHRAYMHGCEATWWLNHMHALDLKRALDSVK